VNQFNSANSVHSATRINPDIYLADGQLLELNLADPKLIFDCPHFGLVLKDENPVTKARQLKGLSTTNRRFY
jgi:hypothetical protein